MAKGQEAVVIGSAHLPTSHSFECNGNVGFMSRLIKNGYA
jgi:hypothetical protein